MQQQLTITAMSTCCQQLEAIGWTWEHSRIKDWLKRVGRHYQGKIYKPGDPLPEFIYLSLAKYLDLRLKCDRLLRILQWDWDSPTVRAIEQKYDCFSQLSLKGYQELHDLLDAAWLEQSGGF